MDDDPDTPRRRVIKHAGNLDPDAAIKHFVASGGDGAGIRVDHKVDVTPAELKRELRETARGSAKAGRGYGVARQEQPQAEGDHPTA